MRSKSPEIMKSILNFVDEFFIENQRMPSIFEVGNAVGIEKSTAHNYLKAMDEKGMLEYKTHIRSTPKTKAMKDLTITPIVGSIPCGPLENEEEKIEVYLPLPKSLFGKDSMYILKASGDSMEDAGIYDGDLVVIELTGSAKPGDIVVALDENNNSTLKKYMGIRNGKAVLAYMNEQVYPGKEIIVNELVVQGIARKVIKDI